MNNKNEDISNYEINQIIASSNYLKERIEEEDIRRLELIRLEKELNLNLQKKKNELDNQQKQVAKAKKNFEKLSKSRSWKLSWPLRLLGGVKRKNKQKIISNNNNSSSVINSKVMSHGVNELDKKLWGGFASYASQSLLSIRNDESETMNNKIKAAKSLVKWYYDNLQFENALNEIQFIKDHETSGNYISNIIIEIKILKKLNKIDEAKRIVWEAINSRGMLSELCLAMSHLSEIENDRLQWYNLLYEKNNFQKIEKIEEQKPLDLENIYNTPLEPSSVEHYKVSVIIPAYNAADLLYVALDSLINQTMKNLEIIVVDDCSSDNTAKVVNEYSRKDSRIKLIQKEVNEGAYAARNTGLLYATGDFITVHDSDDWSHTQKIEIQVKEILKDEKSIGSVSYLVRALKDITPINSTSLIGGKFLTMNSSSLLVKKEVVKMLGGWDSVRVAGDTEYLFRIEKVFGSDSIARVFPNVPLSISLSNENSLTSTSTTNSRTIKFGLRRNYREAFEWWHDSFEEVNQLYLNPAGRHYRFPKPRPILPEKEVEKTYRRIIVVDLSDRSQLDKIKNYIEKLDGSEDIAVFHYPNYENNPDSRITSEVYKLLFNKNLDLLVPNEVATAEEVLFLTPWIYKYELDQIPYLKIKSSTLDNSDNFSDEELKIVKDNIFQMFNVTPKVRPLNTIK